MTSYQRLRKNIELLGAARSGAKFYLTDLQARGPRRRRVFHFVRREGSTLVCVDAAGTPRRFSLMFVSCGIYRPAGGINQSDKTVV